MLGIWGWLVRLLCFLRPLLLPLTESVAEKIEVGTHDNRVFDKLLHAVDKSVPVPAGHQPTAGVLLRELLVCHGYGALVRYDEHAHPSTEYSQGVDRIERLRSTVHLCDCEGTALSRTHRASGQRYPVDLVLENGRLKECLISVRFNKHESVCLRESHVAQGISICAHRSICSVRATPELSDVCAVHRP